MTCNTPNTKKSLEVYGNSSDPKPANECDIIFLVSLETISRKDLGDREPINSSAQKAYQWHWHINKHHKLLAISLREHILLHNLHNHLDSRLH